MKICSKCGRELPLDTDHFNHRSDTKDGFMSRCKECLGTKFTNYLTHIPKEGHIFCKKCDRELPYTVQYFPEDKHTKTGLRNVCRECNPSYGRFLKNGELPKYKWTKEENDILINTYKNYTDEEIQKLFLSNRTLSSIISHRQELNLHGKSDEAHRRALVIRNERASKSLKGKKRSDETKAKISSIRKEYYKTHDGWAKGAIFTEEHRKHISEAKIKVGKWKGNDNPRHKNPLNGEKNGRWKGGILDTYSELRSETKNWFDESSKFCNYKCVITGIEFDNIHHTTAFRDIVDMVFKNTGIEIRQKVCDYSIEEFSILRDGLRELHKEYGFGACINYNVHKLFHDSYGYTKFSPYDFLDFIYKIDVGEFDKWFFDHKLQININYDYVKYLESTLFNLKMSA